MESIMSEAISVDHTKETPDSRPDEAITSIATNPFNSQEESEEKSQSDETTVLPTSGSTDSFDSLSILTTSSLPASSTSSSSTVTDSDVRKTSSTSTSTSTTSISTSDTSESSNGVLKKRRNNSIPSGKRKRSRKSLVGSKEPTHPLINLRVDAQDVNHTWGQGKIIGVNSITEKIKIHFFGYGGQWDRWMHANEIVPFGLYTGATKKQIIRWRTWDGTIPLLEFSQSMKVEKSSIDAISIAVSPSIDQISGVISSSPDVATMDLSPVDDPKKEDEITGSKSIDSATNANDSKVSEIVENESLGNGEETRSSIEEVKLMEREDPLRLKKETLLTEEEEPKKYKSENKLKMEDNKKYLTVEIDPISTPNISDCKLHISSLVSPSITVSTKPQQMSPKTDVVSKHLPVKDASSHTTAKLTLTPTSITENPKASVTDSTHMKKALTTSSSMCSTSNFINRTVKMKSSHPTSLNFAIPIVHESETKAQSTHTCRRCNMKYIFESIRQSSLWLCPACIEQLKQQEELESSISQHKKKMNFKSSRFLFSLCQPVLNAFHSIKADDISKQSCSIQRQNCRESNLNLMNEKAHFIQRSLYIWGKQLDGKHE